MTFRFENKTSSKFRRKSTIIIEQEQDSLLVEPAIKDFLKTQNNHLNHSRSKILDYAKLTPSNQNVLMKLSKTSQGFHSTPSSRQKIVNPQKLTYISKISLKTFQNCQSLLPYSSAKKQSAITKPIKSQTPKSSNIMMQKEYSTLLDNRKRWTSHLIQKKITQTKKKLDKNKRNFQSSNQNLNLSKGISQSLLIKGEVLKDVSSSTWMKLNPENMKQNMIILSKTEKEERKNFFAMKQATLNQQSGLRSLNKLIMLGSSKSDRLLSTSKNKQSLNKNLGIKISLSSRNMVSQKVYNQRQKRREQLQKKGIFLRDPFREQISAKHEVIINVESEFL